MSDDSGPFSGVDLPDAGSEEETERDGLLSYAGEWHALILGTAVGLTGSPVFMGLFIAFVFGVVGGTLRETSQMRDALEEQAYSSFGVILGYLLNVLLVGGSMFVRANISLG